MFENRETSLNGKSVWGTVRSTGSPAGEGNSRNTGMNGGEEPDFRAARPRIHPLTVDPPRESEIPFDVPVMAIFARLSTAPMLS